MAPDAVDAAQHSPFDITDVVAVVLLVVASVRRLDVKMTDGADFPNVAPESFEQWKRLAESAYRLVVRAGILKVIANNLWMFLAGPRIPFAALVTGHWFFFIAWLVALVVAWRRATEARWLQSRLGIVLRGKPK